VSDVDREELARRLGDEALTILDVRSAEEFSGELGAHCDPRQGRIAGARHLDLQELMELTAPEIEERLALPAGAEIVTYCHSGSRSALAVQILRAAGYDARNYAGSWHEWSRDDSLPSETGSSNAT
jgi:thiosulfate/3-mercaptopyruvate sulfurtransferase